MHKPAAYAYQFSFSSSFRFVDEDKSDRFYIGSASGKFVTGPNAGIAFKVSDISNAGARRWPTLNARGDAPFQAQIDAGLSAPNAPSSAVVADNRLRIDH